MVVVLAAVAFLALAVAAVVLSHKRMGTMEATYRQVCLDQGLTPTDSPLGLADGWLAQFELLPRGDRDCSAVWGMEGDHDVTLGGHAAVARCAAFEWWWEQRQTDNSGDGPPRTTWRRRSVLVAAVRLPAPWVMPRIRVEREGLFTRMGIGGRGDFQVESEEFNKRYDVRVADRETAIRLFDPSFQERLLGRFDGIAFELAGDVALVAVDANGGGITLTGGFGDGPRRGGATGFAALFDRSGDRVRTDPQILRSLPTVRHQATALLEAMPEGWWRAITRDPA